MVTALLLGSVTSIQLKKTEAFKIGDEVIDVDDEVAVAQETIVNVEELEKADQSMLADFGHMLATAQKNAEQGDLQQEMAKAQAE